MRKRLKKGEKGGEETWRKVMRPLNNGLHFGNENAFLCFWGNMGPWDV